MKKVIAVLCCVVLLISITACAKQETKTDTSTEKVAATETTEAETTKTEEVTKPEEVKKIIKVGFANINEKGSFGKMVRDSMEREAAARGYELVSVDNNSDGATAVKNADDLITMGIDYFIEFNVDSTVAPVIMEKMDAAKIPVIACDIPHPGAYFFGANNSKAARIAGVAAAAEIQKRWNGEVDFVVLGIQPISGPVVAPRVSDFTVGLKEAGMTIAKDKIVEIDTQNDAQVTQQRISDFLMSHPDARRIVVTTINDVMGAGVWAGVETAGRQDDVILYSHNSTADFIEPLYATKGQTGWLGSVGYFPERYGEWVMPIIDTLVAGGTPPQNTYIEHELITYENAPKYYPEGNYPWSKFNK